ncbi:MAG: anaerobic glycerol-3-phosphate dehydrogenase subunit B [Desulfovibrio sp.]|jgi:glycerol-3-phosphate dehydrogenase|nr:anaerobic glycerol-3-phosphate dehydrogenase subunit B [Desulfovibrio sp.]
MTDDTKTCETRVVIIGGGATGAGVARDLSLRGIPCILLEQGDLCAGASARFHGLLHSGARYVVSDPDAARECISENRILRRIAPYCIEETEGWFVLSPEDDPAYAAIWLAACAHCGIEAVAVPLAKALKLEPNLRRDITAAYRVPDSAVDGFRMVRHNAMSARLHGGKIYPYTRVEGISVEQGAVTGVLALDCASGQSFHIGCEYVINASGAWAGQVAALAGLEIGISPDRGLLLAFNHRFIDRVVNRLRKSADGDIFVPHGSITIFGTSSISVDDPNDIRIESKEALRLLEEGEKVFPELRSYRILRAFAGTRPLYSAGEGTGRSATRNFVILDHADEGLAGMATVTGGKFTSFRMMAEKICDLAAKRLGVDVPCRTALEPLIPAHSKELLARAKGVFPLGDSDPALARLGLDLEKTLCAAEAAPWKKTLLCECELVTLAEFETTAADIAGQYARAMGLAAPDQEQKNGEEAIGTPHFAASDEADEKTQEETAQKTRAFYAWTTLNDIRRRTRMGMGTCQGSFCALRATGALAESGILAPLPPQQMLREFLEERWRGIRALLWGKQLREVELERGIYMASLNIDGPGQTDSAKFSAPIQVNAPTLRPDAEDRPLARPSPPDAFHPLPLPPAAAWPWDLDIESGEMSSPPVEGYDVIVVGTGLSGLIAAITAARRGRKTLLLSRGAGALSIGSGGIDLLGYAQGKPVQGDPFAAFAGLAPDHPYALLGPEVVRESLDFIKDLSAASSCPLLQLGGPTGNAWLPTSAGTLKPVWLAGPGMNPAPLRDIRSIAIIGVAGLKDFSPRLLARGLAETKLFAGKQILPALLPVPPPFAEPGGRDLSAFDLARFADSPEGLEWLSRELPKAAHGAQAALLPAILGIRRAAGIQAKLSDATGFPLLETICPPPSITGLRLQIMLRETLRALSVPVFDNIDISGARVEKGRCLWLRTEEKGTERIYPAKSFIIATGGLFSKGISTEPGKAWENIFKLPIPMPKDTEKWSGTFFFGPKPHLFAHMGVAVDKELHPLDPGGERLLDNVFFVGRILAGYDFATEKSGSGVALCTGRFAGARA